MTDDQFFDLEQRLRAQRDRAKDAGRATEADFWHRLWKFQIAIHHEREAFLFDCWDCSFRGFPWAN